MKTISLIILLLFLGHGYGQNNTEKYLLLTQKNRVWKIKEGKKVTIWKNENEYYKGKLTIVNNETVAVNENQIAINDIFMVRAVAPSTIARGVASSLISALLLSHGIYAVSSGLPLWEIGLIEIPIGGAIATSGILHICYGRKFKKSRGFIFTTLFS